MFKLTVIIIAISQEIVSKTLVGTNGKPGTFVTLTFFNPNFKLTPKTQKNFN